MPELSWFYGIIIRMFVEVGTPHHRPHFHAYYQEDVGDLLSATGRVDRRGVAEARGASSEAWAELHQTELLDDWQRLQAGQMPLPIAPLS